MTTVIPRVKLNVTLNNGKYLINGYSEYEFETGVEYVLTSDDAGPLWLTWQNSETNSDFVSDGSFTTRVLDVLNLTCYQHHEKATDNLIYWAFQTPVYRFDASPLGLWQNLAVGEILQDWEDSGEFTNELLNRQLVPVESYNINGTDEQLFNVVQTEYVEDEVVQVPTGSITNSTHIWVDDGKYVGVIIDGERIDSSNYSLQWRGNADTQRIALSNYMTGEFRVKTNLMHFSENNGSEEVTFILRPDDERTFYLNSVDYSNEDFVCRGINGFSNDINVKQLFDNYILEKYPKIYELILTYVHYQSMRGEPMSYMRNLIEYHAPDTANNEILRSVIKNVLLPFESLLAKPSLVSKQMIDFFQAKGTLPSFGWLSNILFHEPISINNMKDYVFYLSEAEWSQRSSFYITIDDVEAVNNDTNRTILGITSEDVDDFVEALVGYTISGRDSFAVGIIEQTEKVSLSNNKVYRIDVSIKNMSFDEEEILLISNTSGKSFRINTASVDSSELGIIDCVIEYSGKGYHVGQKLLSESTTGDGFECYVSAVNDEGGITSVDILDSGWFYRDYQLPYLNVEYDRTIELTTYDPTLTFYDMGSITADLVTIYDNELMTFTYGDDQVIETPTGDINKFGNSLTNTICVADIESQRYYILPTTTGINFCSVTNTIYSVNLDNVSLIKAMAISNNNFVIAFADRYRSYNIINLFNNFKNGEEIKYKEVLYDAAQTGNVSGVVLNKDFIAICTDNQISLYGNSGYITSAVTPETFTAGYFSSIDGIVTCNFYNNTSYYVQQFRSSDVYTAKIKSVYGRFFTYDKKYKNRDFNILSGSSKLRDNNIVQEFSLVYRLNVSTNKFMSDFESLNPAGYLIHGRYTTDLGEANEQEIKVNE